MLTDRKIVSQALLATHNFIARETVVQENGKVLPELDDTCYHLSIENRSFVEKTRTRPLKFKKKLYEFFTAPITKFWANSVSTISFCIVFNKLFTIKNTTTKHNISIVGK